MAVERALLPGQLLIHSCQSHLKEGSRRNNTAEKSQTGLKSWAQNHPPWEHMAFDSYLERKIHWLPQHSLLSKKRGKFSIILWLRKATWLSAGRETASLLMGNQNTNLVLQGAAGQGKEEVSRKEAAHSWPLKQQGSEDTTYIFSPAELRLQTATPF